MIVIRKSRVMVALAGALILGIPATAAQAQDTTTARDTLARQQARSDTTQQDTANQPYATDTSDAAVQNPPGYRGMERDTTIFPPDSNTAAAESDATSRVNQSARQDSLQGGEQQNPPGYRGMESPASLDSAAQDSDTARANEQSTKKKDEATKKDKTNKKEKAAREGTTSSDTLQQGTDSARTGADATDQVSQPTPQDSLRGQEQQDPAEYQGMERSPVAPQPQQSDTGSTRVE